VNPSASAAGLGLVSAATWGGSDFVGGMGARRAPALLVVCCGHLFSFLVLLAVCLASGFALPSHHPLLYAAIGGFEGSLALAVFYRALAMGAMGLTAALTGLLTALVPVVFGFVREGMPAPLTALGLLLGCIAIWLITNSPAANEGSSPPMALLLGALAGVGFGTQLILFKMANGEGILWPMTAARGAGVTAMLIVLLLKPPKGAWRGFWLTGIAAGVLDTAGNLFYFMATKFGRLDVAAVVCSLYPAGTILLAGIVLHERPTHRQMAGIAVALGAVALLTL
jgi:drug/metabolite transporter (DMT)-like permease